MTGLMLKDRDASSPTSTASTTGRLRGAAARGDWDGTKDLIAAADVDRRRGPRSRVCAAAAAPASRPGPEVVLHAEGDGTARTISSSTPTRASPAPARTATSCATTAQADRGLPDRRRRDGRAHRSTSTSAASSITRRSAAARDRRGLCGRADRQERLRLRLGLRPLPASRRRRLYLRRGDGADREPRGQEGPAAPEAAVPGGVGLYGCPTTVNNVETIAVVPTILRRGADWFAGSAGRRTPAPSCSASPAT